ncbi:hypothetical protein BS47DRAFT_1359656 [Hydnum rufescens UP504]|uniref:Uncharacterized protein n=1 Tax=Hydnum rufescens UP504 TaxID=1448309 RepID=A0A9P6DWD5_9AGAM|nr:hypothetical protein BS47DRAFT_1359656 [Hydnum rufescens UP504]
MHRDSPSNVPLGHDNRGHGTFANIKCIVHFLHDFQRGPHVQATKDTSGDIRKRRAGTSVPDKESISRVNTPTKLEGGHKNKRNTKRSVPKRTREKVRIQRKDTSEKNPRWSATRDPQQREDGMKLTHK